MSAQMTFDHPFVRAKGHRDRSLGQEGADATVISRQPFTPLSAGQAPNFRPHPWRDAWHASRVVGPDAKGDETGADDRGARLEVSCRSGPEGG